IRISTVDHWVVGKLRLGVPWTFFNCLGGGIEGGIAPPSARGQNNRMARLRLRWRVVKWAGLVGTAGLAVLLVGTTLLRLTFYLDQSNDIVYLIGFRTGCLCLVTNEFLREFSEPPIDQWCIEID